MVSAPRIARQGSLLLALAMAVGCESAPNPIEYDTGAKLAETADGLYRVKANRIGAAWLRPGTSFSGYDAVVIDPVTVSYKSPPRTAHSLNRRRGNFALSDTGTERLKKIFQESFEREIGKSDEFSVVTDKGENVLRISGHIVDLVVNAPPPGIDQIEIVADAGEMTLILDVRDSQTGAPLARIADRRTIRPAGASVAGEFRNHPVRSWGAVRDVCSEWARFLRDGLDDLRALPPTPLPEATSTD